MNSIKLILEEVENKEVIFSSSLLNITEVDGKIIAKGSKYSNSWYFDDKDSSYKLFRVLKANGLSKNDFIKCLKNIGFDSDEAIQNSDYAQYLDKLTEDISSETIENKPEVYEKYTFNIQSLPTYNLDVDTIDLQDVPENVRRELAEQIINYPYNQIKVYNDEYKDSIEDEEENV